MDRLLKDRQILVVDDTAVQRVLLMEILRGSGAVLVEASSGERALELASEQAFDAFLLDIRMTGQNGIEVCRALRAMDQYRFTPIIFITAIEERELLQWALEAGADDFIQKPVHGVVLRRRLANLLQRSAYVSREQQRNDGNGVQRSFWLAPGEGLAVLSGSLTVGEGGSLFGQGTILRADADTELVIVPARPDA